AYTQSQQTKKIKYMEFATNPQLNFFEKLKSFFYPPVTDNCNINTTRLGDSVIAMTESPFQTKVSLDNLADLGRMHYHDNLKFDATTAHPHYDFTRQELINFAVKYSLKSYYYFYQVDPNARQRTIIAKIPIKRPAYVHSFAM